jgi:hypothetical protein
LTTSGSQMHRKTDRGELQEGAPGDHPIIDDQAWVDPLTPEDRRWAETYGSMAAALTGRPPGRGMVGAIAGILMQGAHPEGVRLMYEFMSAPLRSTRMFDLLTDWETVLERGCKLFPEFAEALPRLLEAAKGKEVPEEVFKWCPRSNDHPRHGDSDRK